jgi:hypothetical protein
MLTLFGVTVVLYFKSKKILAIFKLYFSHPFCKKGLGLLKKTLMAGFKDGGELIVPVYL